MVQPSFCIRKVTLEDIRYKEEATKVVNAAYRSEGGWTSEKEHVEGERITVNEMEEFIRTNGNPYTLLFAFDEGKVVGTVQIKPLNQDEAAISLFSVSPTCQSHGFGGRLIRAALSEMKTLGFKNCVLHVFNNRTELLAWYKKIGFKETGEQVSFSVPDKLKSKDLHFVVLKMAT
ncbi:acyl-CoA N-acyltransferase, partial [Cokeromyces recurvatus]|uniref:acyl-CoA N-acyltransferase n=1 Tax=Cokeromyces recurvatus TaxID=90255 RepID=UPI0022210E5C